MPENIIGLQKENLSQKISHLNVLKEELKDDAFVKSLTFGAGAAAAESMGGAVCAIEGLNKELEQVAKKLALLSEKTAVYLQNVVANFEEADNGFVE